MSTVVSALLYLRINSMRNIVVTRLKRLKQPKYLIGGIVGVAYIYFVFFRRIRPNGLPGSGPLQNAFPMELMPTVVTTGAVMLFIFFALCWILPRDRAALNFSEAEIAFLFPAPLSRRSLIHYRLMSAQTQFLFTALMLALFSSTWNFIPGNAAIRIIGWWIIFSTLSLHILGSSFVLTRLMDRGVTSLRRQLLSLGVIALVIAAMIAWAWSAWRAPQSDDLLGAIELSNYVVAQIANSPLHWLLMPMKLTIGPLFAADLHSFLVALGPALLMFALHYWWVMSIAANFEEASIAKAQKRAARVAALQQGRFRKAATKGRKPPFKLSSFRRPEMAFLWKNLLSTAEYIRPRTAVIIAAIIYIGCTWLANHPTYRALRAFIGGLSIVMAAYGLVLGPQFARQDLRSDLIHADILKTYPLRGWQIVLGEILTPAAILTVILWLVLLTVNLTFQARRMEWLTLELRTAITIGLAIIMPLLTALQLLVVNTTAVLFPAWLQPGSQRAQGIEVMGQRIFFLAGQIFIIAVALLPASIAGGAIYAITQWTAGIPVAVALGTAVVVAILAAEVWLGVMWLGSRFEKFDLSAELRL